MQTEFPTVPFERYADDVICHCVSEKQAKFILGSIRRRVAEFKLELHPDKTRIVYCKDGRRKGSYPNGKIDFLGFTSVSVRGCEGSSLGLLDGSTVIIQERNNSLTGYMQVYQVNEVRNKGDKCQKSDD
jgi:hypothetical protein